MISIYESDVSDFGNNGLGLLAPSKCEVTETLNGEYELVMEHPIDPQGKWKRIKDQRVLRVPVPLGMTPYAKLVDRKITVEHIETRGVYYLEEYDEIRCGPGEQYKITGQHKGDIAVYGEVKNGWYKVTTNDGQTGYIKEETYVYALEKFKTKSVQTILGTVVKPRQLRDQPFRIYRVVPELDKITVYARHIFYDMLDNWVFYYKQGKNDTGSEVVEDCVKSALHLVNDFAFYSDLDTKADSFVVDDKGLIDAYMGDDGVIDTFGGELCRDWYDVFITKRVGDDSDVTIREAKNLKGIKYDVDSTDVTTRLVPYIKGENGKGTSLPEVFIESPNAALYPHPKYSVVEMSYILEGNHSILGNKKKLYQKMRDEAQKMLDEGVDQPTVTLDVDFINCGDTEEYRQYGQLQNIYLGDSVRVISPSLGVDVRMRMTQYTYDCLVKQYTKMTLGSVADTVEASTISGRHIANGSITSGKLAVGSVGSLALQEAVIDSAKIQAAAIEAAHISQAAIDALSAQSVTAFRATINQIATQELKADALVADLAKITALTVEDLTSQQIYTDRLAAALAAFTVITCGTASFDEATVRHLIASALNVTDATADKVFISNLALDYANIVTANVGKLCVKASDGNFYRLDVDAQGIVSASPEHVDQSEIDAGVTRGGRQIIESSIAASDLSATDIKAVYALINRLDAARIDVDQLTARQAFIQYLETADISSNTSIRLALKGNNRVYRNSGFPADANIDDLCVDPLTGYTYQFVDDVGTQGFAFNVSDAGELTVSLPDGVNYLLDVDADGNLTVNYGGEPEHPFSLSENGSVYVSYGNWVRVKDSTLDELQTDIDDVDTWVSGLKRWIEFTQEGLVQGKQGSIYSTLIDQLGYHIRREGTAGYIGSFAKEGLTTDGVRLGDIICTKSDKGGWVWKEVTA